MFKNIKSLLQILFCYFLVVFLSFFPQRTNNTNIITGADPGFDQGGPQIVTGLKLPFWGLSFVEFWCWGLIFGGQGGPGPWAPPLDLPLNNQIYCQVFMTTQRIVSGCYFLAQLFTLCLCNRSGINLTLLQ